MAIFTGPPKPELHLDVFVCEVLGNAFLMCFGCLGNYARPDYFGPMPPLRVALVFAFLMCSISIAIGYVSGCQLSPCVTLSSMILGRISPFNALLCTLAELLGCFLGMAMAILLVPIQLYKDYQKHIYCGFCTTHLHPNLHVIQGLGMEFLVLFVFILCVCSADDPRNRAYKSANPINFVGVIGVLIIATGPFCGCSFNPFRSLAPAAFSNCWRHHWVYWVGPLGGSAAATLLYRFVLQERNEGNPPATSVAAQHLNEPMPLMDAGQRRYNVSNDSDRNQPAEAGTRTRTRRNGHNAVRTKLNRLEVPG